MLRVLVVDDSALMRRHLGMLFASQPDIEVETARNGAEALALIPRFDPHVVTLDINMPEMDGITCLSHIMLSHPRPVLMVSSITEEGAEVTLQALGLGAVDFVLKPGGTISLSIDRIERELLAKLRSAASARVRRRRAAAAPPPSPPAPPLPRPAAPSRGRLLPKGLVLIGVSTGGPGALEEMLPRLAADFPWPVLIAQHMPAAFTGSFARRLDAACALDVVEVTRQMAIEPGRIHVAKGEADLVVSRGGTGLLATPVPASAGHLWHPSVARLVASAAETVPAEDLIAVQLTGMGNDGAAEMTELRRHGARTIAQDEATSVVFGMPGELVRLGGASLTLPIGRIAGQLTAWTMPAPSRPAAPETRHAHR
ncbi:chemotaxis response regulator protein-glutamate methylesterase 3 [Aureimonas endophytica]|uniref:Protein-glutamate methylesterase/protein-glutamine glutaminase n=1 Tax=Aureimonas endophytica TaxID=2027858 RepID=A0A916ZTC9_9HYPH|nr:chemotaxis-specific protein-glutamate methyltransferase CheB [Aureimonas endophytica]GGE12934.1 chemotaxis response regulator protein-glutamate methylesterase 3 [Aureimonas endophytica]